MSGTKSGGAPFPQWIVETAMELLAPFAYGVVMALMLRQGLNFYGKIENLISCGAIFIRASSAAEAIRRSLLDEGILNEE